MKFTGLLIIAAVLCTQHAVGSMMENNLSRKPSGEMMKTSLKNMYELFKMGQIEDLVNLFARNIDWDATALRSVLGGQYNGRDEVRTMMNRLIAAVDISSFTYEFVEADEGHGTTLSRITMKGKYRNTEKSFVFMENHLCTWRNGQLIKIKLWGDQRDMMKSSTNKIMQLQRDLETAFFARDIGRLKQLAGNVKVDVLTCPDSYPRCGPMKVEDWMKDMQENFHMKFNGNRIVHASEHYLLAEWTMDEYSYIPTGRSLMGHKPEDFRMFNMIACDDKGKLTKWEIHSTPVPSNFLFMETGGSYQMPKNK